MSSSGGRVVVRDNQDVNYSLISAVREGKLERARELINYFGLSYSQAWSEGYVLLCDALKNKHAAVAKLLLTSGSKVNNKNEKSCNTPLHFAVINGDIEIIKMILDKRANINAKNQYGKTPLHIAIQNRKIEVTELLIKHGADVNARDNGRSPLHVAVEIGCLQIVEHLLNYGAYVNCVCKAGAVWRKGYVPLHFAVENGSKEVITLLLSRGANVDVNGEDGITPLHIATKTGCKDVVKLLLQHGAKVDNQDKYGKTTLHLAVEKGYLKIVEDLLKYGADVNTIYNSTEYEKGFTPLHHAAKYGQEEVAKLLISYEADINAQDKMGKTPIFYAIENGDLTITKVLLECGAKVDSKMQSDITPLHWGAREGSQEIVETILKFGANIDSRDAYGRTALHFSSDKGHVEVVVTLLEYGSDINITDINNDTPLYIAMDALLSLCDLLGICISDDDDDYYYSGSRVHSRKLTAEALQHHIVKMKIANLYLSKQNLLLISSCGKKSDFQDECAEEIASMKSEKINNSNISFYDILAKGTSSLAIYMRNENIVQVLKSNDYKTKFPKYASMIESHFRKGMERKELLERGNKIFHFLFNNFPELPIEKIFSYLSNEDLKNFDGCL